MKCPYCGKEVDNTAKTCPRCYGGLVKETETPAPDKKRQAKPKPDKEG